MKKIFVKPQLCKEFGVTERTLGHLTELELIKPEWQYRHGLQVVELSESDREVLECAGNCLYNDINFRLPFQRFLYLRFMQMPLDLIEFELAQKNLLDLNKYDDKYLQRRYEAFLSNVPKKLRPVIEEHRPPKTKEEKRLFEILLDVCEVRLAYENPMWDESFGFLSNTNIKTIIDCFLSTTGTYEQVSDVLHELLGVSFTPEGLVFYQELIHDMKFMNTADIKEYFKGVPPSRKEEMQRAHGASFESYKLQSGLQMDIKTGEIVEVALQQTAQKLLELTSRANMVDANEVYHAIRTFNMLSDRTLKIAGPDSDAGPDVGSIFKNLSLKGNEVEDNLIVIDIPKEEVTTDGV